MSEPEEERAAAKKREKDKERTEGELSCLALKLFVV